MKNNNNNDNNNNWTDYFFEKIVKFSEKAKEFLVLLEDGLEKLTTVFAISFNTTLSSIFNRLSSIEIKLINNKCNYHLGLEESMYFSYIEILLVFFLIMLIIIWIFFSNYKVKSGKYFINVNMFIINYLIIIFTILSLAYVKLFWWLLINFNKYTFFLFFGQVKVTCFVLLFKVIISLSTLIYMLFLRNQLKFEKKNEYKFLIFIPFTSLGSLILVQCNDFISLILSIEIVALSLYSFIPSKENSKFSTEASLKYYIIGSVASAILILGCSIIYLVTGAINLEEIRLFLWYKYQSDCNPWSSETLILLVGVLFIYVAILTKIGVAPFHFWVPEVYGGSPLIVTMFISLIPKIAYFNLLINLSFYTFSVLQPVMNIWFIILGTTTIIFGVFGAMYQLKVRRFIAYSMFTNTGLFVTIIGFQSPSAIIAVTFSLILYVVLMINLFGSFLLIYDRNTNRPFDNLYDIVNLSKTSPTLAMNIGFTLISLAGLPFLSGFFIKFELIKNFFLEASEYSAINNFLIMIGILYIILSLLGSFYYLRIYKLIAFEKELKVNTLSIKKPDFLTSFIITIMFLFNLSSIFFVNTILSLVSGCVIL